MDIVQTVVPSTQSGRALVVLLAAILTLAIVWILQAAGYAPCELCLTERYAFYAALPLSAATLFLARASQSGFARAGFAILAAVFFANAVFAFYHVGVEQHWWLGPTACTGSLSGPVDVNDLMKALNTTPLVRCDEASLRIFGVSLAGWDVVASAALAAYCAFSAKLSR